MKVDLVRLNIQHFRRVLKETTDIAKRRVIEKLLKEEEAKPRGDSPATQGNSSAGRQK